MLRTRNLASGTERTLRIQLLADLALPERGVLWDLGAGVGSVGLEALRLRPALQAWFLEQRGGSAALIAANAITLVSAGLILQSKLRAVLAGQGPHRAR